MLVLNMIPFTHARKTNVSSFSVSLNSSIWTLHIQEQNKDSTVSVEAKWDILRYKSHCFNGSTGKSSRTRNGEAFSPDNTYF